MLLFLGMTKFSKISLSIIPLLLFISCISKAQNLSLIGKPEQFAVEQLSNYKDIEERAIEHEEYPMLIFRDADKELEMYFSFYRNEKICDMVRVNATAADLKEDLDVIKSDFTSVQDKTWENSTHTIRVKVFDDLENKKKIFMVIENIGH